ncbi:MAG: S-layer homology domain-containing protein [Bacillota bacterium]
MKLSKRLGQALCLVLILSLCSTVVWAAPGGIPGKPAKIPGLAKNVLQDIFGHWAEREIEEMQSRGLIKGYDDLKFRPSNEVTGQEAIAMLVRAMGLEKEALTAKFELKKMKHEKQLAAWARGYFQVAYQEGIITDADLSGMIPNKPVKRADLALYLTRVLQSQGFSQALPDISGVIEDAGQIPRELRQFVAAVYGWGLMLGDHQKKWQPNKPLARAEMAVILSRLAALLDGNTGGEQTRISGVLKEISLGQSAAIKVVEGSLVSVSSTEASITVRLASGRERIYALAAAVEVWLDGARSRLNALKPGFEVKLTMSGEQVAKIDAVTIEVVEGSLTAVTIGSPNRVTVTINQVQHTYPVSANALVTVNNSRIRFNQLEPGGTAKLTLRQGEAVNVEVTQ